MTHKNSMSATAAADLVQRIATRLYGDAGAGITDMITLANRVKAATGNQPGGEVQGDGRTPADIAAILRAMASNYSSVHCWDHLDSRVCIQAADALAALQPRADLVPGIVRCAKCAFQLARTSLYMHSGTVGAGDSKTEPCPNGCGPLWPVTWETWAREGWAEAERLHMEKKGAQPAQTAPPRPLMLKGFGKINGDGWKETTVIGEVVYVWADELPPPHAPGQFLRVGNQCGWTASTKQYEFQTATPEDIKHAFDDLAQKSWNQAIQLERLNPAHRCGSTDGGQP